MEQRKSSSPSSSAAGLDPKHVPDCYVVPPTQCPDLDSAVVSMPVIDMARLRDSAPSRALVVEGIGKACRQKGFFQVINHGICPSVMVDTLRTTSDFFELPMAEKMDLISNDVNKPVRYSTNLRDGIDRVQFWRVFLKHYAHPINKWIQQWPSNPPNYREKMGRYAVEVRRLALEVMGAIMESLGLGNTYMGDRLEDGMQVMAINCYPPCPQPDLVLGLPPHSDHGFITILHQSCQGLQVMDPGESNWRVVPVVPGSLHVHVGDHLEVLSNGLYKSVMHRVTLSLEKTRFSVASIHGVAMDDEMGPADELVGEQRPRAYKDSSFRDFLNFISSKDISNEGTFIDSLKIAKN